MMLLNNISSPFIPGPPSQQMSAIDLFFPGFSNISGAASQALSGNWTIYTQLMCIFALAIEALCASYKRLVHQVLHIDNPHQNLRRNIPYGTGLDLIPGVGRFCSFNSRQDQNEAKHDQSIRPWHQKDSPLYPMGGFLSVLVLTLEAKTCLDLFSPKLWRRVIVGCGVMFFQQFSGINAFIYYAPTLFQTLGQDYEMSLIMSGVFNMLQLVAVSVCFLIIDNVGRRRLAIFGGLGGCVSWSIMAALVGVYSQTWASHTDAGWAAVAMAFLFILMYGCTYAPLGWALPSEVFPSAMRSKGVALSTSTNWICNFIVGLITPPMLESWGYGTYIFYGAWCGLAVVWAYFFVLETKGKTLEQMDEVFGDKIAQEERELFRAAGPDRVMPTKA